MADSIKVDVADVLRGYFFMIGRFVAGFFMGAVLYINIMNWLFCVPWNQWLFLLFCLPMGFLTIRYGNSAARLLLGR